MGKNDLVDKRLKLSLILSVIFFIYSLTEMIISFFNVNSQSMFQLIGIASIIGIVLMFALLLITFFSNKFQKFDTIGILLILATLVATFGQILTYMFTESMPHKYIEFSQSYGLWFIVSYFEGEPNPESIPQVVSTSVIVNINLILSTLILMATTIANFILRRKKNG